MNRDLKNLISFGVAVLALLMFGLIIKFKEQVIHYGYIFLTIVFIVIYIIIIILVLAIIVYVFKSIKRYFQKESKNQSQRIIYRVEPKIPVRKKWPYQKNKYLLYESEKTFYNVLKNAIGDNLVIFPKVRLADIVHIPKTHAHNMMLLWNKIRAKHVDYLLCNLPHLSPIMVIELVGSSHNHEKAKKNDEFKNQIFEDAGIPFLRITKSSYYKIEELKMLINEKLNNKQ